MLRPRTGLVRNRWFSIIPGAGVRFPPGRGRVAATGMMGDMVSSLQFSILDRANIRQGVDDAAALRAVVDRARRVETLGYHRFLVAEHHGVPGIAGSAPTLLATAVAAATDTIRVGTAGIMMPAHPPLVIAEQILTLAALFPGRIDAGIGRSLGFTRAVRQALRQADDADEAFSAELTQLKDFLQGTGPVRAMPELTPAPPLYVLANGRSIRAAAEAGLGVIVGGPSLFNSGADHHEGLVAYRRHFRPSALLPEPRAIIAANIAVADTREQARQLLLPEAWALARSRRHGTFEPLRQVTGAELEELRPRDRDRIEGTVASGIYGTPGEVAGRLEQLLEFTGVGEIVLTGGMWDQAGQERSDELLADLR